MAYDMGMQARTVKSTILQSRVDHIAIYRAGFSSKSSRRLAGCSGSRLEQPLRKSVKLSSVARFSGPTALFFCAVADVRPSDARSIPRLGSAPAALRRRRRCRAACLLPSNAGLCCGSEWWIKDACHAWHWRLCSPHASSAATHGYGQAIVVRCRRDAGACCWDHRSSRSSTAADT